ncbi:hypothetical protein GDO81_008704 [Engystomops pustulosus]|uniref:Secreted protein n=1 Tax=Engystomops pustulosus TaxID=76066 RepID=A0AAV7CGH7_ENGPU|nr:hypothetical protein GDO81_008704 [Engystomops pustulosus]
MLVGRCLLNKLPGKLLLCTIFQCVSIFSRYVAVITETLSIVCVQPGKVPSAFLLCSCQFIAFWNYTAAECMEQMPHIFFTLSSVRNPANRQHWLVKEESGYLAMICWRGAPVHCFYSFVLTYLLSFHSV